MKIVFDDERPAVRPRAADVELQRRQQLGSLETEVKSARQLLKIQEEKLKQAIADAKALDGMTGLMYKLTGQHGRRVDEAIEAVKKHRANVVIAQRLVAETTQRMEQFSADVVVQEEAMAAERAFLDDVAAQMPADHPLRPQLAALDTELVEVQVRVVLAAEVVVAVERIAAAVSVARTAAVNEKTVSLSRHHNTSDNDGDTIFTTGIARGNQMKQMMRRLPGHLDAFRQLSNRGDVVEMLPMMPDIAREMEYLDNLASEICSAYLPANPTSMAMFFPYTDRLEGGVVSLRELTLHIAALRKAALERAETLQDERFALLESA